MTAALEQAREIDTVVFDKTGTLTTGQQGVVGIETIENVTRENALALAAAVEGDSEHLIARDSQRGERTEIGIAASRKFSGAKRARRASASERTNNFSWRSAPFEMANANIPDALAEFSQRANDAGQSVIYVLRDGKIIAACDCGCDSSRKRGRGETFTRVGRECCDANGRFRSGGESGCANVGD